jgi:hypothetical protein
MCSFMATCFSAHGSAPFGAQAGWICTEHSYVMGAAPSLYLTSAPTLCPFGQIHARLDAIEDRMNDARGGSMSTDKDRIREMLERIWANYEPRFDGQDHDLIVLAIPRYPANIEAIAALDLSSIADVLATFIKSRESADERPSIKATGASGSPPSTSAGSTALGQGGNAGGPPQERGDPSGAQGEGDAAGDAVAVSGVSLAPIKYISLEDAKGIYPDRRYVARLRGLGLKDDRPIVMTLDGIVARSENGDLISDMGVWDTVEKRFVKRDDSGNWVPE